MCIGTTYLQRNATTCPRIGCNIHGFEAAYARRHQRSLTKLRRPKEPKHQLRKPLDGTTADLNLNELVPRATFTLQTRFSI